MLPKTALDVGHAAAAAGKKAAAEGEAIVRRACEQYCLPEHPTGRPRPWPGPWPGPPPLDPEPDYDLSERDREDVHGVVALLKLAQITTRPGTRRMLLRNISVHLQHLRDRAKQEWFAILKNECGLGQKRAYELLAFAKNNPTGKSNASPKIQGQGGKKEG